MHYAPINDLGLHWAKDIGDATFGISLRRATFHELGILPELHTSWNIIARGPLIYVTKALKNSFIMPELL